MVDPNIAMTIEGLTEQMAVNNLTQSIQVLGIALILLGIMFALRQR